jgi:hypothetical protein
MTTEITQSVIYTNLNCTSNSAYSSLIKLRTTGFGPNFRIPITTLEGRLTGANISFDMDDYSTYEAYKMRRKAEVLKYRQGANATGVTVSNRKNYNNIIKTGGPNNYSSAKLKQIVDDNSGVVPDTCSSQTYTYRMFPASNSGVHIRKAYAYYLDPSVNFYPSL